MSQELQVSILALRYVTAVLGSAMPQINLMIDFDAKVTAEVAVDIRTQVFAKLNEMRRDLVELERRQELEAEQAASSSYVLMLQELAKLSADGWTDRTGKDLVVRARRMAERITSGGRSALGLRNVAGDEKILSMGYERADSDTFTWEIRDKEAAK